ncbi:polysaccharide deacetylase family protein [Sulfurirhabdus autotrophica]|uniref:Peptidoglycan/xylan/chitin deacetylase (PgdA/CDA1 family) n=1 Tax=Sulfurirhabdus autotrophica TaxID=1706046 RepID=A0A4R3Y6K7_9PROT|nr:polysaccharide deacetylase family protein [Sulfurirhabdus autotrophica]TCV87467.1 peptidoglycan/xylan/chitin deacetylase (PgdA/CDA1 family) [Sulfurirhabdus autotrophica]
MASSENSISGLNRKSRPWRPAPAIGFSIKLHIAGLVVVLLQPSAWQWVLGLIVLNHTVLAGAVLWPKGQLLGSNITRLPDVAALRSEVSLTFDDGPDPVVTPRVLDLLDQYQAKASFFCLGARAEAHPEIIKDILRRGHSVENHSYSHPNAFSFYGISRLRREVENAQKAIASTNGHTPLFFRAPAGFRSPMLDPVLAKAGLHYASWTRRGFDGVKSDPALVLQRLTQGLAAGDILLLHDVARSSVTEPAVLLVLPKLLKVLAEKGLKSVSLPAAFGGNA